MHLTPEQQAIGRRNFLKAVAGLPALAGLGVAAAVVFTVLAGIHLDGQGVYYDELHQAPAAFDYLGKHAPIFNYSFHGIPILNMSYSGAIKSNVYGLYLRYVNPHFTVYSWRLVGIVSVAIGIFGFFQIAGVSLPLTSGVLFAVLLLSDASVILATRHDWGPTALALCFRLAFLAVWLSIELREPSGLKHFTAGFLVGVAIFEKLSAVVLLTPFCILLFTSRKRAPRAWIAGVLGILAGALPLLLVNIGSYMRSHSFVSLSGLGPERAAVGARDLLSYAYQYFALAQGGMARQLVLGDSPGSFWPQAEAALTLLLLVIIAVAAFRSRSTNRLMTLAGIIAASYLLVGISVFLLPRDTFVHHWILGTPFHYGAIALALPAFANPAEHGTRRRAIYRAAFVTAVAAPVRFELNTGSLTPTTTMSSAMAATFSVKSRSCATPRLRETFSFTSVLNPLTDALTRYGPPTRIPGMKNRPSPCVMVSYLVPEGSWMAVTAAPGRLRPNILTPELAFVAVDRRRDTQRRIQDDDAL